MFIDVSYEELRDRTDIVWIDVRSEGEFADSTIPGAVNIPLFDNAQRAEIGTVYKQVDPEVAKELGLTIASAKFPDLVREIRQVAQGTVPALFCWRGGMRSKSVATLVDLMGVPCIRVRGGYRAYREYVTARLAAMTASDLPPMIVIHGMTGVGKTMILQALQAEGEAVLDLEEYARHRGSVFGGIGLVPANQRHFESELLAALDRSAHAPYVFMEAESKRIGHATMPEFLYHAKLSARNIAVTAPVALRVERTLAQYRLAEPEAFYEAMKKSVMQIERRFSPELRERAFATLARRDFSSLIATLLVDYYDPRYQHAMRAYEQPFTIVDGTEIQEAVSAIRALAVTN